MKMLQPCIDFFFAYDLGRKIADLVSSVTLECYIVQFVSRSAFLSTGFPTNIVYHVICSVAAAYCLYWLAGIVIRKFSTD